MSFFIQCDHMYCSFCVKPEAYCPQCSHTKISVAVKNDKTFKKIYELISNLLSECAVYEESLENAPSVDGHLTRTWFQPTASTSRASFQARDDTSAPSASGLQPNAENGAGGSFQVPPGTPKRKRKTRTATPGKPSFTFTNGEIPVIEIIDDSDQEFVATSHNERTSVNDTRSGTPPINLEPKATKSQETAFSDAPSEPNVVVNGETAPLNNIGSSFETTPESQKNIDPSSLDISCTAAENGESSSQKIVYSTLYNGVAESPPVTTETFAVASHTVEVGPETEDNSLESLHTELLNDAHVSSTPFAESPEDAEHLEGEKSNESVCQLPSEYFLALKNGFQQTYGSEVCYLLDLQKRRSRRIRSKVRIEEPLFPPKVVDTPRRTSTRKRTPVETPTQSPARKRSRGTTSQESEKKTPSGGSRVRQNDTRKQPTSSSPNRATAKKRHSKATVPSAKKAKSQPETPSKTPKKRLSKAAVRSASKADSLPPTPASRKKVTPARPPSGAPRTPAVKQKNTKGETLLHLAVKRTNLATVKDLLDAGADPNEQDNAGWTPLVRAVVF